MLILPPPRFRPRRDPKTRPPAPMLVLEAAWVNLDDRPRFLWLRFDRAVDLAGYRGSAVLVYDGGENLELLDGTGGASLYGDPMTVRIELVAQDSWDGPDIVLAATAGSGIAAAGDRGMWAGANGVVLPFP